MSVSRNRSRVLGAGLAFMIGAALLVPQSAYAWWPGPRFAVGIRVPLVLPPAYLPPPVYAPPLYAPPPYAPPVTYDPPAYIPAPARVWVPPHYTPRGVFIPGHFVYR